MILNRIPNFVFFICIITLSCGPQNNNQSNPFGVNVICTTHENINYGTQGSNPNQTLDLYVPQFSKPGRPLNPLVIYIHGGGFIGGDKQQTKNPSVQNAEVASLLNDGIAFASINYPLINLSTPDNVGIIKCLNNCKAAIQFLRGNSGSYGIDPDNIALWGDSAGAGLSMLIGFNAQTNPNPIKVIFADKPQATYDLQKWSSEIFSGVCSYTQICDILSFDSNPGSQLDWGVYLQSLYGLGSGNYSCSDIISINNNNYPTKVDILSYINSGDPPIWIENTKPENNIPLLNCNDINSQNGLIERSIINHHINHGIILKNKLIGNGLEWYFKSASGLETSVAQPIYNSGIAYIKSKL